jgi:hypothetical protein
LLDFAIHCRQNKTLSRNSIRVKIMHVHGVVSCGRIMQQACKSVTLASPLIFFHRGCYNNNSLGTFYVLKLVNEHSGTRQAAKHTARKSTMHQLQHTSTSKGPAYILTTEDRRFLIKKILTPDGHTGQNM